MKLQHQLWLIYSVLFILVCLSVFMVISNRYENHLKIGYGQVTITQGAAMLDRLKETYPYAPKRSVAYLRNYSQQFNNRLIILDQDKQVYADSFGQLDQQARLNLAILESAEGYTSEFYDTENFGYVQYTLLPFATEAEHEGYLLIISEASQLSDEIKSFQFWIIQMLGIALVAFFVVSYFLANWFSSPIRKIIFNLKQITPQKRTFSMAYKRNDEIKELIDAIEKMSDRLNQYDERQKRFLTTSSHELKTPLTTISLILENLPYAKEDEEIYNEFIQDLAFQAKKMKQMIEQLLQMNAMWDVGSRKESINTQDIKAHLKQSFQYIAEDKNIALEFDFAATDLYVDKTLFLRGIDNVVSNALRYSPANQPVKISIKNVQDEIKISICDRGIGISPGDVEHIFEPFYRSNDATAWNQEGSGLGLYIVKQMVEIHQGRIEVNTELGQGTRIDIFLKNLK
ncbi:MAG: HAMP domain-containing sensor histidine kinase [Clostridiales bacterium]